MDSNDIALLGQIKMAWFTKSTVIYLIIIILILLWLANFGLIFYQTHDDPEEECLHSATKMIGGTGAVIIALLIGGYYLLPSGGEETVDIKQWVEAQKQAAETGDQSGVYGKFTLSEKSQYLDEPPPSGKKKSGPYESVSVPLTEGAEKSQYDIATTQEQSNGGKSSGPYSQFTPLEQAAGVTTEVAEDTGGVVPMDIE